MLEIIAAKHIQATCFCSSVRGMEERWKTCTVSKPANKIEPCMDNVYHLWPRCFGVVRFRVCHAPITLTIPPSHHCRTQIYCLLLTCFSSNISAKQIETEVIPKLEQFIFISQLQYFTIHICKHYWLTVRHA